RWQVTPPAYTRHSPYVGPLPEGGLSGLPGTQVQVWASSNRPLSGGQMALTIGGAATQVALKATSTGSSEATGEVEISNSGKFELSISDIDGHRSRETFGGTITLLRDDRPFIRILEPPPISIATPDATLPIVVSGEDDYGIARVDLYRNLNDSRPLP